MIEEAERLFPDLAPIIDFDAVLPGSESVETLSQQLLGRLQRTFHVKLFMTFCHLNSERLLDWIGSEIEGSAYPFDVNEVLAETFYRLHSSLASPSRSNLRDESPDPGRPSASASVFEFLTAAAGSILEEYVSRFTSSDVPLPLVPLPEVDIDEKTFTDSVEHLASRSCELERKTAAQWVAHALLGMDVMHRRVIMLRNKSGEDLSSIAEKLGVSRFQAGVICRNAADELHTRLEAILIRFQGPETSESGETRDPGLLKQGPWEERPSEEDTDG